MEINSLVEIKINYAVPSALTFLQADQLTQGFATGLGYIALSGQRILEHQPGLHEFPSLNDIARNRLVRITSVQRQ